MIKKMVPFVLTASLVIFSGCGAKTGDIEVATQTNAKVNLDGYTSYAWLATADLMIDKNDAFKKRSYNVHEFIQSKITKELLNEDKIETSSNPDFLVSYVVGVDMDAVKKSVDDDGKAYLENIPEAGLAILLIDPSNQRVIYAGSAETNLDESATDEESKERIVYAIEEILDDI
jgi:hypothetical protein